MLAFIRFTPKMIEELRECLSNLPPEQQLLCNVLFWSGVVLFFIGAGPIISENAEKKSFIRVYGCICFSLLLMIGSHVMLGLGCS